MGRSRTRSTADRLAYSVETQWSAADLVRLEELRNAEALLPDDAPRALLSVRLSVLTECTTSPVRQELDLRVLAGEMGFRVIGVARDLNVSATKVPPWERRELGDWLNNRSPEFDVLLFWKLDRFVRRLSDLATMIDWCLAYGKNLVSKHDSIDLTTAAGKAMVAVIGGMAEIEAAGTSTRVASLWEYAKTRSEWLVGKPSYGYMTAEDGNGRVKLVIDPDAYRVLHWCRHAALRGVPASRMVKVLTRSGIPTRGNGTLTTSTMLRRLRNPALLGYRVKEDKNGAGARRSMLVLGDDGNPIRVAEPVFTQEEFDELQAALDRRGKNQPARRRGGATRFLGVLICAECGANMTVQVTTNTFGTYKYLRCRACPSGGPGAPNPDEVYGRLIEEVLSVLGDHPVETREYEKAIGPGTMRDRWITVHNGRTFGEEWETGGMEAMAADLLRAGITCEVTRTKIPGVRAPEVHLCLLVPEDVRTHLVRRQDHFRDPAGNRRPRSAAGVAGGLGHPGGRQVHEAAPPPSAELVTDSGSSF